MVLGGTDGDLLQESAYLIDFEKKTVKEQDESIGCQVAMGKLVYRP